MALRAHDRFIWDATVTLEALGAADVALWSWDPTADRLRLTGAARRLGLSPLAPECSSAAVRALSMPQDRALVEEILRIQAPGVEIGARVRMRGGDACIWRGVWLEDGVRAAGAYSLVVADLDRLRRLNEALGHERADLVLAALGSRLGAAFPPQVMLARVGEDEFAVLAPADVAEPAEMMRRAMEQPLRVAGFDIFPT